MKYSNSDHKIRTLWNETESVAIEIPRKAEKIARNKNNVYLINKINSKFKGIYVYENEWEYLDFCLDRDLNNALYKEWILVFDLFPIHLLPYFSYSIITRKGNYFNQFGDNYEHPAQPVVFQIEDINDDESLMKVTANIGWLVSIDEATLRLVDTEVKLRVEIYNPAVYK